MSTIIDPIKNIFRRPSIPTPTPPPNTPQRPTEMFGSPSTSPTFQSFIGTGSATGLKRKASTKKRSLIGGSA